MSDGSVAVCLYCGCKVQRGDSCCYECYKEMKMPDCAIGERLSNLELLAELMTRALKKEVEDEQR